MENGVISSVAYHLFCSFTDLPVRLKLKRFEFLDIRIFVVFRLLIFEIISYFETWISFTRDKIEIISRIEFLLMNDENNEFERPMINDYCLNLLNLNWLSYNENGSNLKAIMPNIKILTDNVPIFLIVEDIKAYEIMFPTPISNKFLQLSHHSSLFNCIYEITYMKFTNVSFDRYTCKTLRILWRFKERSFLESSMCGNWVKIEWVI